MYYLQNEAINPKLSTFILEGIYGRICLRVLEISIPCRRRHRSYRLALLAAGDTIDPVDVVVLVAPILSIRRSSPRQLNQNIEKPFLGKEDVLRKLLSVVACTGGVNHVGIIPVHKLHRQNG